jgi:hypothetical protein
MVNINKKYSILNFLTVYEDEWDMWHTWGEMKYTQNFSQKTCEKKKKHRWEEEQTGFNWLSIGSCEQ